MSNDDGLRRRNTSYGESNESSVSNEPNLIEQPDQTHGSSSSHGHSDATTTSNNSDLTESAVSPDRNADPHVSSDADAQPDLLSNDASQSSPDPNPAANQPDDGHPSQIFIPNSVQEFSIDFLTFSRSLLESLTSRIRLAFGRNMIEMRTTNPNPNRNFEFGVAFETNTNWNEREVPEEFGNTNPIQFHSIRQRLFRTIFTKIVLLFVLTLPPRVRKAFEYFLLIAAVTCLFTLTYLHVVFVRRPRNCLENVPVNWTTDGILRLEVMSKAEQQLKFGDKLIPFYHLSLKPDDKIRSQHTNDASLSKTSKRDVFEQITSVSLNHSYLNVQPYNLTLDMLPVDKSNATSDQNNTYSQTSGLDDFDTYNQEEELYAVEFSAENGFLRLSSKTRQKLNIPTKVLFLDPDEEKCFGGWLSRSLLKYFFGYNDILMNSLKYLAEKENNRGYVYNVVTGEHYRFVNVWMTRTSYIAAAFIMLVFTLTISMLLRYSHHQVFVFVAQLTQLLEFNTPISFPFAPLLTVVLALIGMEAIMTEFFNDSGTAFYILLIVWTADQYDWFCCYTSITRRNWLKFFYLYHFAFYAYVYRFSGQYADLALLTSWLFILHSMVYFFHRYELPYILSQSARITVTAEVHQATMVSQLTVNGNTVSVRILRSMAPPNELQQAS